MKYAGYDYTDADFGIDPEDYRSEPTDAIHAYMISQEGDNENAVSCADSFRKELLEAADKMLLHAELLRRFASGDTSEEVTTTLYMESGSTYYTPVTIDGLVHVVQFARQ